MLLGFVIEGLRARIALFFAFVVFVVVAAAAVVDVVVVLPYVWDRFMSLGLLASAALEKHHQSFEFFASRLSSGGSFQVIFEHFWVTF